jgi:ATP-dependent helicase/nuclease subunit A
VLAHRILETWQFSRPPQELLDAIAPAIETGIAADDLHLVPAVSNSLREIFRAFGASQAYQRLRSATILGREVPFIMPWGKRQVMEGVIDLVYRLDGELWIADYKTDQKTEQDASARGGSYTQQADIYRKAVMRCLGLPRCSFHLLFLRTGTIVEVS